MNRLAAAGIVAGAILSVIMYLSLRNAGLAAYHRNPFALNQSGYGTLLARLGQENLNRAWHYGAVASELSKRGGEDDHAGHNHGPDDGHGHDHGAEAPGGGFAEPAMDFFVDLDAERYRRTSTLPISKKHEMAIARDIEEMLLKAYNLDPTDYGSYDAYFHFLVFHVLKGTEEDRRRASQMSEYSIQTVFREKVDPIPWLTASTATMNQFILHQRRYRMEVGDEKAELPVDILEKYRDRMRLCLGNYYKLKAEAEKAHRWENISEERREEADERGRLGLKMLEQFTAMIERIQKGEKKLKRADQKENKETEAEKIGPAEEEK